MWCLDVWRNVWDKCAIGWKQICWKLTMRRQRWCSLHRNIECWNVLASKSECLTFALCPMSAIYVHYLISIWLWTTRFTRFVLQRAIISETTSNTYARSFASNNTAGRLYGVPRRTLAKLQRVQTAALPVVSTSNPVLRKLHWLPVEYRVQFRILILTFKALHGEAPSYVRHMLHLTKPVRVLRSQCAPTLEMPRTRSVKYGDRAFCAAAPALWNDLPANIRCAKTLDTFKMLLKTYFFFR